MSTSANLVPFGDFGWDASGVRAVDRTMPPAVGVDVVRTLSVRPEVFEQRIEDGSLWRQGTVMPLGRHGELVIDRPFLRANCSGLAGWRGSGRLVGRVWPVRALGRVDIEILPWSAATTGIRLARRSPLPSYWGARRGRRYWALAHAAADQLAGPAGPATVSCNSGRAAEEAGEPVGRRS